MPMSDEDNDDDNNKSPEERSVTTERTPTPTDWQHGQILFQRNVQKDWHNPKLYGTKFWLLPVMLMLYCIGFFLQDGGLSDEPATIVGNLELFDATSWHYPHVIRVAAQDATLLERIEDHMAILLKDHAVQIKVESLVFDRNRTSFLEECQATPLDMASQHVCVILDNDRTMAIFYGGKVEATPFQSALAGVQWAISHALVSIRNATATLPFPVTHLQRTPKQVVASDYQPPLIVLMLPNILHVLACVMAAQFMIGPITYEKVNHVSESFLAVGVTMRTYLFAWIAYFGVNLLPTAVCLTLVTKYWNLMPLSSPVLVGLSHYLGLIHMMSQFTLLMQFISQEESAQGLPFLIGMISMAVGAGLVYLGWTTSVLMYMLSCFLPFVGMIQYYAIYATYDYAGYDTGISAVAAGRQTVVESGLLGSFVAQGVGILMVWIVIVVMYSSEPGWMHWLIRGHQSSQRDASPSSTRPGHDDDDDNTSSDEAFEPLPPTADVVIRVRGVEHAYQSSTRFISFNNINDMSEKETKVLMGLDMDICRGEVFGFLGHNGAGKTTSVGILAGQIKLQRGRVTYRFRSGNFECNSNSNNLHEIRTKIGVCPQHNTSLQEDLTAREHLRLFALLKGNIAQEPGQSVRDAIEAEVEKRLADVKFTSIGDADKPIGTYSGGMKRKVLIAMALLGNPEVVLLDEPTAGLDPYNRRSIWDMIVEAKQGRSIILTTHFLDEADVLSDRVGIIKNGKLITCGSSLFLKHASNVGYTLTFDAPEAVALDSIIDKAEAVKMSNIDSTSFKWKLGHGTESKFPDALRLLKNCGASNIQLGLTTLEEVFLATGKEDFEERPILDVPIRDGDGGEEHNPNVEDLEANNSDLIGRIWEPHCRIEPVSWWRKLVLINQFMMVNAWKAKGAITLNITLPLVYLTIGVVLSVLSEPELEGQLIVNDPIAITPDIVGQPARFFGLSDVKNTSISPLIPSDPPMAIDQYHQLGQLNIVGGYFEQNQTLQYAPEMSAFALQVATGVLTNYSAWLTGALDGISVSVQQLPYLSETPFRADLLFIPYCISFGFAGLAFSVLDILLLKGNHIIGHFRVVGITEWTTYLGVMLYKCQTTFVPFFVLLLVLGFSVGLVIFGDAGRWLGTLLLILTYAFSSTPIGLILAKRFIHSDYKTVANWFPGAYFTLAGVPYIAYSSLLQVLPEARESILIVGDVLSVIPQVAFQRGLGAILEISSDYRDEELSWGQVWSFDQRVWFTILIMCVVGTLEWYYLYRLTTARASQTKLQPDKVEELTAPIDISDDPATVEERDRSQADPEGINARDVVKVFCDQSRPGASALAKKAVKGISFGIRQNEIFALLGPNGAGKTVTMSILAGEVTPEHGSVALNGVVVDPGDRSVDHLFGHGKVSYVPQFDALFPRQTVHEHLKFYAQVRGMSWTDSKTQEHVNAIVKLLGLEKHREKESKQLSGGYKRRLSLAVALIGYPKALMLDEVTTGLDPSARRLIWDVLKPPNRPPSMNVPSILLSTHYMEEAEALGDRIAIMVDGQFVAAGTLAQLYGKYCTSYFIELSLLPDADTTAILGALPHDATVYESLPHHLKLEVPLRGDPTDQLAHLFNLLENQKTALKIQFYSIAKMNLEQIFIHLSRQQFKADEAFEHAHSQQLSV